MDKIRVSLHGKFNGTGRVEAIHEGREALEFDTVPADPPLHTLVRMRIGQGVELYTVAETQQVGITIYGDNAIAATATLTLTKDGIQFELGEAGGAQVSIPVPLRAPIMALAS
jgi:hypothetical protein